MALSRVVERVESLLHERTLRNGAVLRFGELTLDVVNERAMFGALEIPLGHTETRPACRAPMVFCSMPPIGSTFPSS